LRCLCISVDAASSENRPAAVHRRIVMRFIVSLAGVLTAIGVGFAFLSAERTIAVPALAIASPQVASESRSVAAPLRHNSQFAQVDTGETPGASGAPTRAEQESQAAAPGTNSSAPNAPVQNVPTPAAAPAGTNSSAPNAPVQNVPTPATSAAASALSCRAKYRGLLG
jgi:hypothetical protein